MVALAFVLHCIFSQAVDSPFCQSDFYNFSEINVCNCSKMMSTLQPLQLFLGKKFKMNILLSSFKNSFVYMAPGKHNRKKINI